MSEIHEEHAPDCTCGCHDNDHDHDHHHHHEHARDRVIDLGWASVTLESHVHEQASTVSATICARADSAKCFDALVAALQAMAREAESAGGIIGHIKGYARDGESFVRASITDAQHAPICEGDAQLPLGSGAQVQLVAIVMLIDLDELERIVAGALEAL